MGQEQNVLPPPTGSPVVAPRLVVSNVAPPPLPSAPLLFSPPPTESVCDEPLECPLVWEELSTWDVPSMTLVPSDTAVPVDVVVPFEIE